MAYYCRGHGHKGHGGERVAIDIRRGRGVKAASDLHTCWHSKFQMRGISISGLRMILSYEYFRGRRSLSLSLCFVRARKRDNVPSEVVHGERLSNVNPRVLPYKFTNRPAAALHLNSAFSAFLPTKKFAFAGIMRSGPAKTFDMRDDSPVRSSRDCRSLKNIFPRGFMRSCTIRKSHEQRAHQE